MSSRLFNPLLLLCSYASTSLALHAHNQRHQHAPRQFSILPIFTEASSAAETPDLPSLIYPPEPEASPTDIAGLANDLDSCLNRIPADIVNLMSAIDARVQEVQNLVSSLVHSPAPATPTIAPPLVLPTTPAFMLPPVSFAIQTITYQPGALSSPSSPPAQSTGIVFPLPPSFELPPEPAVSSLPVSSPVATLPVTALPPVSLSSLAATVPSVTPPVITPVPISVIAPPSDVSTSLCRPPGGAGPLVPCANQRRKKPTTLTLTQTISTTVTFHISIPNNTLTGFSTGVSKSPVSLSVPTLPLNLTTVTDVASIVPVSISKSTIVPFNANSRSNLAVYYGNTPATTSGGLSQLCRNEKTNIVILSFIYDFFSRNNYPSAWLGQGSCDSQTASQTINAPGLSNCSALASQISECQQLNKKVLVSLGGYIANSSFTSDLQARRFAVTLWNLFGAGTGEDADLRPFGNVVVDGFDIDNEDGSSAHWNTFASAMRALFNSDVSKDYYLSAAPQCPFPDASNDFATLQTLDFVWVQFYNNPSCNLDSRDFADSFHQWSTELRNMTDSLSSEGSITGPKLYIGIPAFAAAGSGFVEHAALGSSIRTATEFFLPNQGGIMLWDGSEAMKTVDPYGNNYLDYAKWALID